MMTIETATKFLEAHGYKVTKPKAPTQLLRMESPNGKPSPKGERCLVEFIFEDGEIVRSYAVRETPAKAWLAGSAARAACDKYRYRATATPLASSNKWSVVWAPIESVEVPIITSATVVAFGHAQAARVKDLQTCTVEPYPFVSFAELSYLNAATADYRKAC